MSVLQVRSLVWARRFILQTCTKQNYTHNKVLEGRCLFGFSNYQGRRNWIRHELVEFGKYTTFFLGKRDKLCLQITYIILQNAYAFIPNKYVEHNLTCTQAPGPSRRNFAPDYNHNTVYSLPRLKNNINKIILDMPHRYIYIVYIFLY